MNATELLDKLNYPKSPNFFSEKEGGFDDAADCAHVFRRANADLDLKGVYTLRQSVEKSRDSIIPVVYICEVKSETDAKNIHRLVWNQNIVPFVIVVSPDSINLYSGFRYSKEGTKSEKGILGVANEMSEALDLLEAFQSEKIDNGSIWKKWSKEVTPETRVDWKLLCHLNDLDLWLQNNGIKEPEVSHGLIGKYVYLRYLFDRDILSEKRLKDWKLTYPEIFSRKATLTAFWDVVDKLDNWLKGSVFPIPKTGENSPRAEHIRKVAGVFSGDEPSGQLSLDFEVYDFSFIPIETLSVIYEQFLHAPIAGEEKKKGTSKSKGKEMGAYYTPVPVVNFMLEEMDTLHPLVNKMKVLDPSCGSGAFLVQTYRRIIENDIEFKPGSAMRPARLRKLLEDHIFGIDRDLDACRVAELSLSLTLLDYVDPPDLTRYSSFKLPMLRGSNIFHGDFFDPNASWRVALGDKKFDWIVGNPPWVELKTGKLSAEDKHVWEWFVDKSNAKEMPTGGYQVAEAFAWEVTKWCENSGLIALLMPAMTLFKHESKSFRESILKRFNFECVANLANLRFALFPGHRYRNGKHQSVKRPTRPAVAIFYGSRSKVNNGQEIAVYSPFLADLDSNRSFKQKKKKDIWSIAIDTARISYIRQSSVADGRGLQWKTAMWGSEHDFRFLEKITRHFKGQTLLDLCKSRKLDIAEGFQLRNKDTAEKIEHLPEIVDKYRINMNKLNSCGEIYSFPVEFLVKIKKEDANLRLRGGRSGLKVSSPPHVIIDKARRFAIYEDRFIAVPPRQIGITGGKDDQQILKALSLYLVSDFSIYHQFFTTPEWGVSTPISTLKSLKQLPVPISKLSGVELLEWSFLHKRIVLCEKHKRHSMMSIADSEMNSLKEELNQRVYGLVGLNLQEQYLISDLVNIRMHMMDGKISNKVLKSPEESEVREYCSVLRDELDSFVDDQHGIKHKVTAMSYGSSAVVVIQLLTDEKKKQPVSVFDVNYGKAVEFENVRKMIRISYSQWYYFNRNLRIYDGQTTCIFKPLLRLYWTKSQALQDASSVIAETLQ